MDKVLTNIVQNLQFAGISQACHKVINLASHGETNHSDLDWHFDRAAMLKKISLFRSLTGEELERLAEASSRQFYVSGETLIRQGDPGDSMFVLVEGLLDVFRSAEGSGETRIARIQTGCLFGEMSLLTGEPRSATIKGALDVVVLKIHKDAMVDLFECRPELVDKLSRSLAERRLADKARESVAVNSLEEQTDSLAAQIKKKIQGFFRLVFDGAVQVTSSPDNPAHLRS